MGDSAYGIDPAVAVSIASQIQDAQCSPIINGSDDEPGVEIAIVVGGGNIWRGLAASSKGMDRSTADYMGMVATVLNGLALQDALEHQSVFTRVMTAIEMKAVAEPYIRRRALRHLEKRRVVILAGGTGHPYFSTDTAAALRGVELEADALLKGTQVDGVYDKDPKRHPDARRFAEITFDEVLARSGAPRGSVYHHFPAGRSQLLREALEFAGQEITTKIDAAAGDSAAALLHQFVPAAQALLQVIANTGSTASLRSQLYELGDMNRVLGAEQLLAAAGQYAGDD